MLEITADHISELADDDLRTLVGLLCEAELSNHDLPVSAATWGGNQRAADGGLDVRVALPAGSAVTDFVPRPNTGFQVKRQDMPRTAILAEMRPSNAVRPVIRELADVSGAYVIVSSQGSTSDSALRSRRAAMAEAVAGLPNAAALLLDFYDRTRLASWVRQHPGLIPWVREKIGRPLRGWHSYGPWAYEPEGTAAEFLLDDTPRVKTGKKDDGNGLSTLTGIVRIRNVLREPGSIVRLIGLSGVGKTRLVQALFDGRIGERALDSALALYTNMSDDPDPQPIGMVSDLLARAVRAIVVVDNCAPELHRRLSEVCRREGSTVSVITVEYDIREDEPEGTQVFELLPSSEELVERLIKRRFPDLSPIDVRTAAEFSGGNARIAIALATTVGKQETLSGLANRELFQRLFQQRHEHDASLLQAAQACALVYSFQGEALTGDEAELPRLAALIGVDAAALFRSVSELLRRELAQRRGVWRAVLPHAIANRLAAAALEDIPFAAIEEQLINGAPERLLKSFSRRLGYLETCAQAVRIATTWLAPGGLLSEIGNLNDLGRAMFKNIAPVIPEEALAAMERPLAAASVAWTEDLVELSRSLAWDPALFERCVTLLAKIAAQVVDKTGADEAITSLFQLYLSGTRAPILQRTRLAESLLRSADPALRSAGLLALRGLLRAWHFTSGHHFEFGARSRDLGYWPSRAEDIQEWFDAGITLARRMIVENPPVAPEVRRIVANRFRELWTGAGIYDALEEISRAIMEQGHWAEGWIAVRQTLRFDHDKESAPEVTARLRTLEAFLRPRDLVEKVRSIVLSERASIADIDAFDFDAENTGGGRERTERIVLQLGEAVARDDAALRELLPELLSGKARPHLLAFGRGLSQACAAPEELWDRLVAQLELTPENTRNTQVLGGFLDGLNTRDPGLTGTLLDQAVEHDTLGPWLPALQTALPGDESGINRLTRALAADRAAIASYHYLAYGRFTDPISGPRLRAFLTLIAAKPAGHDVAMKILSMRFHSDLSQHRPVDPDLATAGRVLLAQLPFGRNDGDDSHRLKLVAKASLTGTEGPQTGRLIWRNFVAAAARQETYAHEQHGLLRALFSTQPAALLDEITVGDDSAVQENFRLLRDARRVHGNPVDAISAETLLAWCRAAPATRFLQAAVIITPVTGGMDGAAAQWTPAAQALLAEAPDAAAVLDQFLTRFRPESGWSGSLAAILDSRAALLRALPEHHDPHLAERAIRAHGELQHQIELERQWETRLHRSRDERFE
jgi:hypothetical protein